MCASLCLRARARVCVCVCTYVLLKKPLACFITGCERCMPEDSWAWGGGLWLCVMCVCEMCETVYLREFWQLSECMLLSSSSSWDRRNTPCLLLAWSLLLHPVPLRLLPATRGQCVYPATHCSPPLSQLFVSFFKLALGDLCRCCLSSMAAWQRETSGEQLSTAAEHAASPAARSSYHEFPCRHLSIPILQYPFNYHFELK